MDTKAPSYTTDPNGHGQHVAPQGGVQQQQQQDVFPQTSLPQYEQPQQAHRGPGRHNGQIQPWKEGYCDFCSPFRLCMESFCCTCFVYGKTRHREKNGTLDGYESMNGPCAVFCVAAWFGVSFLPIWLQRADMREKHHLEGNGYTDCLSACCCPLCDIVQQEKESETRLLESHAGYQAQPGMMMQG